ncbi:hypothetical protein CEXT_467631 [Caerostris extrusa]|uniref:Uncharacterized protein n=1 Tax=Caerostris extrusa TaxID=172846 RepID=A0AAV4STQ0_CAEEX|nr:hypothetical protein CEXT_467631 [Caerostris extrusa]
MLTIVFPRASRRNNFISVKHYTWINGCEFKADEFFTTSFLFKNTFNETKFLSFVVDWIRKVFSLSDWIRLKSGIVQTKDLHSTPIRERAKRSTFSLMLP